MSSYTLKELSLLKFTSIVAAGDFSLILPFIRKECGNIRTINAYRSRYYDIAKGKIQVELNGSTQLDQFNNLNIQNTFLRKLLKPEFIEIIITVDSSTQTTIQPKTEIAVQTEKKIEKKSCEIGIQTKDEVEVKQEIIDEAIKEEKHDYMEHPVINFGTINLCDRPPLPPKRKIPALEKPFDQPPPKKKRKLNDGSALHIEVPSHTDSNKKYLIKKYRNTNTVFCSCPAWKYQKKCAPVRTCKHIIKLNGWDNEVKRISENKKIFMNRLTKKGNPYKV